MTNTRYLPLIGLLLWLMAGTRADTGNAPDAAADASRQEPAPVATVPGSALLLSDGGEAVQLQGAAFSAESLRQTVDAMVGVSQVILLRVAVAGEADQALSMLPAGDAPPVTLASLLSWLDGNGSERILLLLELLPRAPAAAADVLCRRIVTDDPLPSKARLALICSVLSRSADAAVTGPFDAAIARIDASGEKQAPVPISAYGLLAELGAQVAPGTPLVSLIRGRDWLLPMAGVTAVDKLDADLLTVSTPGLSATDLSAALARLEGAGVVVRVDQRPAVSVRVIAVSADAAARLRAEVERLGGEVSIVFDNNLFALIPVDQLRPLAGSKELWSMEANRRMSTPFEN